MSVKTCRLASEFGHVDFLQYCFEHGCSDVVDSAYNAVCLAAIGGHLSCLAYAYEHGCPLNITINNAAYACHLDYIKYCHEHGCFADETCKNACMRGMLIVWTMLLLTGVHYVMLRYVLMLNEDCWDCDHEYTAVQRYMSHFLSEYLGYKPDPVAFIAYCATLESAHGRCSSICVVS